MEGDPDGDVHEGDLSYSCAGYSVIGTVRLRCTRFTSKKQRNNLCITPVPEWYAVHCTA
jgi:hypothetical protein